MSYTKLDSSGKTLSDSATSWAMVKDNVTGLIWEVKTSMGKGASYSDPHNADNTYTWYNSNPATNGGNAGVPGNGTATYSTQDFIGTLNTAKFGSYTDWRLPTVNELRTIVNYSILYPGLTIQTAYFPYTQASGYWSATTDASYTSNAWSVLFNGDYNSLDYKNAKSDNNYARAVRGGSAVSTSYTDNGNGTVTDNSTMLMWQQGTAATMMNWKDALSYCENLSLAGYTDWRLPTIKELHTLVNYSVPYPGPIINTTYFPNTQASWYCTSTTGGYSSGYEWLVDFSYGDDGSGTKDDVSYARAVRRGQLNPILSVNPLTQNLAANAGTAVFNISNTGIGTMSWTASVTSGSSWLSIASGSIGTNSGAINCSYTANFGTSSRTATMQVTAAGATGSPAAVTLTQSGGALPTPSPSPALSPTPTPSPKPSPTPVPSPTPTPAPSPKPSPVPSPVPTPAPSPTPTCTATLTENLALYIPYITYLDPALGTVPFWADFSYNPNLTYQTLLVFQYDGSAFVTNTSISCKTATLSNDLVIHIPNILYENNNLWADLTYNAALSANGIFYFVLTNAGMAGTN